MQVSCVYVIDKCYVTLLECSILSVSYIGEEYQT